MSVRKRVVKIFRDICLQELDFPKRVDVFSKMLRRITDEEGVQVLYPRQSPPSPAVYV